MEKYVDFVKMFLLQKCSHPENYITCVSLTLSIYRLLPATVPAPQGAHDVFSIWYFLFSLVSFGLIWCRGWQMALQRKDTLDLPVKCWQMFYGKASKTDLSHRLAGPDRPSVQIGGMLNQSLFNSRRLPAFNRF